jgi:hypothetical protein
MGWGKLAMMSSTDGGFVFFLVDRTGMPVVALLGEDEETVVSMLISSCFLGYSLVCVDFSND